MSSFELQQVAVALNNQGVVQLKENCSSDALRLFHDALRALQLSFLLEFGDELQYRNAQDFLNQAHETLFSNEEKSDTVVHDSQIGIINCDQWQSIAGIPTLRSGDRREQLLCVHVDPNFVSTESRRSDGLCAVWFICNIASAQIRRSELISCPSARHHKIGRVRKLLARAHEMLQEPIAELPQFEFDELDLTRLSNAILVLHSSLQLLHGSFDNADLAELRDYLQQVSEWIFWARTELYGYLVQHLAPAA